MELKEENFNPSTLETIDFALFNWLNEEMNIFSSTTEGWRKVPVIWTSAERAHQIKNNQDVRDSSGMIKLPLITVERKTVVKDISKSPIPANIKPYNDERGASITIAREIQQEKTSNFRNADTAKFQRSQINSNNYTFGIKDPRSIQNNKIVYETITIPIPIYVFINYEIHLKTEYLQQVNEMITPFYVKNGNQKAITLKSDSYFYEAFIKEIETENNSSNLAEERKLYGTKINIEVVGKLSYSGGNLDKPKVVRRENAVEVKLPRERVITGDSPEYYNLIKNKTNYRE